MFFFFLCFRGGSVQKKTCSSHIFNWLIRYFRAINLKEKGYFYHTPLFLLIPPQKIFFRFYLTAKPCLPTPLQGKQLAFYKKIRSKKGTPFYKRAPFKQFSVPVKRRLSRRLSRPRGGW
ncbi:hypothetical protein HMPREF0262_00586 [Clostridium sp. ATCC 29733]|nr:hypothetical protein HMPREF0262_00586 [Clostridium sp. ATCC 29733]